MVAGRGQVAEREPAAVGETRTHSLTHSLTHCPDQLTHSLTRNYSYKRTRTVFSNVHTHSLITQLTPLLPCSLTPLLTHSLTPSRTRTRAAPTDPPTGWTTAMTMTPRAAARKKKTRECSSPHHHSLTQSLTHYLLPCARHCTVLHCSHCTSADHTPTHSSTPSTLTLSLTYSLTHFLALPQDGAQDDPVHAPHQPGPERAHDHHLAAVHPHHH